MQIKAATCLVLILALPATGCAHDPAAPVEIRTVEVIREVPRDCPGIRPDRPSALERPAAASWERIAKLALAKLAEFSGEGQYVDQAEAIFNRCPLSAPSSAIDGE